MLKSEKKKMIFDTLRASGDEKVVGLVDLLADDLVQGGKAVSKITELEADLAQYKDLDLAELKSAKKLLDDHGGGEAILKHIANSEGYADDKAKTEGKIAEYEKNLADEKEAHEDTRLANARLSIENEITTKIADNFIGPQFFQESLLNSGSIFRDEQGKLMAKVDDKTVPFDESIALLKLKHSDIAISADGSGSGLGDADVNGNKNNNSKSSSKREGWKSAIEQEFEE